MLETGCSHAPEVAAGIPVNHKEIAMRTSMMLCAMAVLLAACGTPEERAAYREDPVKAMSAEYGPACVRQGLSEGSEQWRNCVVRTSTRDELARQSLFYDRYMQWYWLR